MTSNKMLRLYVLLLATTLTVLSSCKKDKVKTEPNTPPVYSNGQGEIGSTGGTVMIDDASSPINGASIVIPEGALESTIDISIQQTSVTSAGGYENILGVKFLPEGSVFRKKVEITIPWSTQNQTATNSRVYYLDETNSTIKQLEVKSVSTQNKHTTAYTSHFSVFFSNPDILNHTIELVKTGNYFGGYFNLQSAFDQIPTIIDDGRNADDIIDQEDGLVNCSVRLIFQLHEEDGLFWKEVADMSLYIDYDQSSGNWSIWVNKSNSSLGGNEVFEIFHNEGLTFEQMTGTWMSGDPFLAIFDEDTYMQNDFSINQSKKYRMSCTWGIVKDYNGFLEPYVWTWQYNYESDQKKWSEASAFNGDANQNNIIDTYESGTGGNNPPNEPANPSPLNNATNISVNTNLSWTCTDPEGDQLNYNVYFGTSSNPPLVEEYYTPTTFEPGTLAENTTYYWYIKAYEVGNNDNQNESEHWQFTTSDGGGGTTGTFTDPRDGQTYATVEIGNQTWFAQNLNYETSNSWTYIDDPANGDIYGRLYTWEAALNACPSGWHLPGDEEWKTMEILLGMSQSQADIPGWRGTDQGEQMKSTSGWNNDGNGTNSSGFNALPGGHKFSNGSFNYIGNGGFWWSATDSSSTDAWGRYLFFDLGKVGRGYSDKTDGRSVRCLKD
ncbi:MAG: fibrobacter succinogenes major paralogous domain-containing protein [Bacteroidales bacterium]|nr:fibrobacter succinogenes major paralogous domain-containing protein [Bacteroidales bacterium]